MNFDPTFPEQGVLDLPPMHGLSIYCKLEGNPMMRWDCHAADINGAIGAVTAEVNEFKGKRSAVLVSVHKLPVPVVNTGKD